MEHTLQNAHPQRPPVSAEVLSIFEDDKTKTSRVQVKAYDYNRTLSKFFYVPFLGQDAVDEAIIRSLRDFSTFNLLESVATNPATGIGAAPVYTQADGSVSAVPGEIPPPIPEEARAKPAETVEAPKKRTASPKASKSSAAKGATTTTSTAPVIEKSATEDEWETVESPYVASKSGEPVTEDADVLAGKAEVEQETVVETPHIKYDKSIAEHRSTLAAYLTKHHPNWKTGRTAPGEMSGKLTGKPFLDMKGNVLESFNEELKKLI